MVPTKKNWAPSKQPRALLIRGWHYLKNVHLSDMKQHQLRRTSHTNQWLHNGTTMSDWQWQMLVNVSCKSLLHTLQLCMLSFSFWFRMLPKTAHVQLQYFHWQFKHAQIVWRGAMNKIYQNIHLKGLTEILTVSRSGSGRRLWSMMRCAEKSWMIVPTSSPWTMWPGWKSERFRLEEMKMDKVSRGTYVPWWPWVPSRPPSGEPCSWRLSTSECQLLRHCEHHQGLWINEAWKGAAWGVEGWWVSNRWWEMWEEKESDTAKLQWLMFGQSHRPRRMYRRAENIWTYSLYLYHNM